MYCCDDNVHRVSSRVKVVFHCQRHSLGLYLLNVIDIRLVVINGNMYIVELLYYLSSIEKKERNLPLGTRTRSEGPLLLIEG